MFVILIDRGFLYKLYLAACYSIKFIIFAYKHLNDLIMNEYNK